MNKGEVDVQIEQIEGRMPSEAPDQDSVAETRRLKAFINDLMGVIAIPAIWSGSEPLQVVRTLLDVLSGMLSLDLAYALLNRRAGESPIDILRVTDSPALTGRTREIGEVLAAWLGDDPRTRWPAPERLPIEDREMALFPLRLGLQGEIGAIVVGSQRADFPTSMEKLLLSVAADQATIGLHEARLLREQRQVASELDRRVAQRTRELATANATLRREIAERTLMETMLRREEAELKRSEACLSEAERLSATGSFSVNPATGAHWWSAQTYRIFGVVQALPPTFAIMQERVHPDDLDVLNEGLARAQRGEGFSMELRLRMPDGTAKHLQVVAHATDVTGADPFEVVGAVRDVTVERRSEEALTKARAELAHIARVMSLGALTASIAHEVNQPLSGIITNASTCLRMLAADPPNVEGARDTAHRTIRDGNRAAEVITRLRALFSKKAVTTDSVDLNEATREVVALSLSELTGNGIVTAQELAQGLPTVTGDRVQLQQVVLNLLRNASDAMSAVADRPRQIVIKTAREESNHVRLSVQDAGVGVDPHCMDRLFEAFYTTKSDGMGIGLYVCRSIIENHHGRLWATPNDGPGVTVSFSIPCPSEGAQ